MVKKFDVFNPFQKWKKGDLPVNSHISIVTNELNAEKDGRIRLTVNLATDLEIDHHIDRLQKDLESVRKAAKRTLKMQNEKIRASFEK